MSRGSPCEGSLAPQHDLRPAAGNEYSIAPVARFAPLIALVAGALLLILGEFLTVREIRAVTVVPPGGTSTGGDLHNYALGIIGAAILPLSYLALMWGARPAMTGLLVLALLAVWIVLFVDRPALDDTGLIGRTYDLAEAQPAAGYYVEVVGAVLALLGAIAALVLGPVRRTPRGRAANPR
jgi:uncharacterized membrane protein YeaQ/YmgE (transglycosylase-associated protein family)